MICETCLHPESEHIISVGRCNHPAGEDAHCVCDTFLPLPEQVRA